LPVRKTPVSGNRQPTHAKRKRSLHKTPYDAPSPGGDEAYEDIDYYDDEEEEEDTRDVNVSEEEEEDEDLSEGLDMESQSDGDNFGDRRASRQRQEDRHGHGHGHGHGHRHGHGGGNRAAEELHGDANGSGGFYQDGALAVQPKKRVKPNPEVLELKRKLEKQGRELVRLTKQVGAKPLTRRRSAPGTGRGRGLSITQHGGTNNTNNFKVTLMELGSDYLDPDEPTFRIGTLSLSKTQMETLTGLARREAYSNMTMPGSVDTTSQGRHFACAIPHAGR
jgi:hypothetical protein